MSTNTPLDDHQQMHAALAWSLTIAWWTVYPVGIILWHLAWTVVFLFKLLYWPVAFLLQPVFYLGRFMVACLALPYTLAVRLETIYIYLGIAAIVGVLGGLTGRGVYSILRKLLSLDKKPVATPRRSVKQYREEKRQKKLRDEPLLASSQTARPLSPGSVSMSDNGARRSRPQRGLLNQIIHEEDDSEF
ncbi:Hypothetical predicted protein [Lecanosticta acicola]|uniref:Uncharacterized protein n=1 Tax=Lecanosticta acicola TaxID=111012 RepID=A0AAI8YSW5_9PEZI|nr:Hypothetical predicted protein [Lecanosticta acicola]